MTRSFSGQGGEVWENTPSRSSVAGNTGVRGSTSLSASSRVAGGSSLLANRGLSGSLGTTSRSQIGNSFRFGYPYGFRGGCWSCGFGFGFGGWGFGGLGFWNPFWFDPWWGIGPAYGYGYYGYPNGYLYGYPDSGYYGPDNNSNPPPDQPDQDEEYTPDGNWATPNGPSPSSALNSGNVAVPVLIYLKSGAVYTVRDYWIVDGELHYILVNGVQNSIDLEQVDLPRTNTENAKSGVKFIFKSEPSIMAPAPDGNAAPTSPGPSESSPAPAPTQQINAVPQPEART